MFEVSLTGFILFFCYPFLLIATGIYVSFAKEMNPKRYYYADKNINWFIVGFTSGATAFLSPYILGFTYKGFTIGLPLIYGIISSLIMYGCYKYLFPYYQKENIQSIPEYFEKRYNRTCRYFISLLYIIENIGIRFILAIIAGTLLINFFTNLDAYFSLLFFLVITIVSLIIGGIKSEIYIGIIQYSLIILVIIGFSYWFFSTQQFNQQIQSLFLFDLLKLNSGSLLNLIEVIIVLFITGFWFIGTDQIIFQKSLCTKNLEESKKSFRVLMLYQIIPVLIFTLPALIIFNTSQYDIQLDTIKKFFINLPEPLKSGIIISIFFALTSIFSNCFSSSINLVIQDFYCLFNPKASGRELVLAGRITLILLLFISILLISIFQSYSSNLFLRLFYLLLYFASMISALMLSSLLFSSLRAESALIILIVSTLFILLKITYEFFYEKYLFSIGVLDYYLKLNYLQYSIFVFVFTFVFHVFLSKIIRALIKQHNRSFSKSISNTGINRKIFLAFPVCFAIIGILEIIHV